MNEHRATFILPLDFEQRNQDANQVPFERMTSVSTGDRNLESTR